jgi:hypothetical protein
VIAAPDCELYLFRGSPPTVAPKLYALSPDLVERPVYASLLRGAGQAEVRIFEGRDGRDLGTVAIWQGADPTGLTDELIERAMDFTSGADLREGVLAILRRDRQLKVVGPVPRPVSPRAAFGHPLRIFAKAPAVQVLVIGL